MRRLLILASAALLATTPAMAENVGASRDRSRQEILDKLADLSLSIESEIRSDVYRECVVGKMIFRTKDGESVDAKACRRIAGMDRPVIKSNGSN